MPHVYIVSANGGAQRTLVERAVSGYTKKGYEVVRQEGGVWGDLLTQNLGGGLFDERSVIVVEAAEKLGDLPLSFAATLEGPDAPCVLLLVCKARTARSNSADQDEQETDDSSDQTEASANAIPVPKQLLDKCTLVKAPPVPPPWSKERDRIVISSAKSFGISASGDVVAVMKELFDDIDELANETAKVAQYCAYMGRRSISLADVQDLCLADGARDMLQLTDGLCDGKRDLVLMLIGRLSKSAELQVILASLHNRFRLAAYIDHQEILAQIEASDHAKRMAASALRSYGRQKIVRFLAGIIEMTMSSRSGIGDGWRDLEIAAIELMS